MHHVIETHSLGFDQKRDRAVAVILSRDLRGGLRRTPVTAVARPDWGTDRATRALARAAEQRVEPLHEL